MSTPRFTTRCCGLLLGVAISAPSPASATTWYVRTDGGTAQQCTGRSDAPYPGSGSDQACAWKSPHYALPADGATRIQGGDTLIIGPGDYMIGWGAPGAEGGRCSSADDAYDCHLAPVPSGPDASAKTRILGKGHATGCKAPPTLWGTERVNMVLNLHGSDNVEVGCLEITDRSDCVEFHSDDAAECERDDAPYGKWASVGIAASDSRNVWLHDLRVHGLANTGLQVGGLTDWTVERVKINANGWAGWNGDIGSDSSNAGDIILRNVEIAWNGCGERWRTSTPWACWAQQGGGYGDGLGTAETGGDWLIEDSRIHHNTSDGLDLLYLDGKPGTSVTVRRVYAAGNAGNQIKTRGAALIENSVVVGNCAWFDGKGFMQTGDHCRAMGNAISVTLSAGQTTTIRHNTITGQGDCLIVSAGGSASSRLDIRNNVLIGQQDFTADGGQLSCAHYADDSPARVRITGNALWHVKGYACPPGNLCGHNPRLRDMGLAGFDARPLTGSPLLGKAVDVDDAGHDFFGRPRPVGGADIGAVEAPQN